VILRVDLSVALCEQLMDLHGWLDNGGFAPNVYRAIDRMRQKRRERKV